MTDTATLTIRVNGGAPQTGGIYAADTDTIQLGAVSKSGWPTDVVRWELYDYPAGFACPAGWTTDTDDDTRPTYFVLGASDPPSFDLDGWGAYKTRLVVPIRGLPTDEATFIKVLSPNRLEDEAAGEGAQFGGTKLGTAKAYHKNLQLIEDFLAAAALPSAHSATAAPPAVAAASALGAVTTRHAREDHTHQGVVSVSVTAPITNSGTASAPNINVSAASTSARGTQSISHYAELEGDPAFVTSGRAPVVFARTGSKWINPNSATPCADMLAASTAGYHRQLNGDATYTLETTLALAGANEIFCKSSKAILVPHASFTGVGADSDTNYVFNAAATVSGASSGTLIATVYQGGRVARWSFQPTNGASYMMITGAAGSTTLSGMADQQYNAGGYGWEVVKVVSSTSVGGGNYDVTFDRDINQPHYGSASSTLIYLVSATVDDVVLSGLHFNFASSTHACGIVANASRRLVIDDCDFTGFSRAAINAIRGGTVDIKARTRGGTNCLFRGSSVNGSRIRVGTVEGGDRVHASGVPRGLITLRSNCSNIEIYDSQLVGGTTAISIWGGVGVRIRNTEMRDMDQTDRVSRDSGVNTAPVGAAARCAGGLDINGFVTGDTEACYAYDITADNVDITNAGGISAGGSLRWPAAFVCDVHGFRSARLGIHNDGAGATGALAAAPNYAGPMLGLMLNDAFEVQVEQLDCQGIALPIMISGNGATKAHFGVVNVHNKDGYTTTGFNLFSHEDSTGVIHIRHVRFFDPLTGYFGYSALGSTPATAAMENVTIDCIEDMSTGNIWDDVSFAKTTVANAIGERVEVYDNASVRSLRNPSTTYETDKAIAIAPYGRAGTTASSGDWVAISRGPRYCVASTETPARGAKLTAGTTRDIIEHVAGAPYAAVGQVVRTKSGGLIQVDKSGETLTGSAAKTASTYVMRDTSGGSAFATVTCDDLLFPAAEATPTISQTIASSGAGVNLAIKAQQGSGANADGSIVYGQDNGATDVSGGHRFEMGRLGAVAGRSAYMTLEQNGTAFLNLFRYSTSIAAIHASGTDHLYLGSDYRVWIGIGPFGAGSPFVQIDQSTGVVQATGTNGGIRLQDNSVTWCEVARVAASRNVVGLAVGANLDTTKMPANTGNGVLFIGNAGTPPTATPNNTGCGLYSEATQLRSFCSTNDWEGITSLVGTGYTKTIKDRNVDNATTTSSTSTFTAGTIRAGYMTGLTGAGTAIVCVKGYRAGDVIIHKRDLKFSVVAGVPAVLGTPATLGTDTGAATTIAFDVSTDLRVRVTPPDSTSTKWSCTIDWEFEAVT